MNQSQNSVNNCYSTSILQKIDYKDKNVLSFPLANNESSSFEDFTLFEKVDDEKILVRFLTPNYYIKTYKKKKDNGGFEDKPKEIIYHSKNVYGRTCEKPNVNIGFELFFLPIIFKKNDKKYCVISDCPFSTYWLSRLGIPAICVPQFEDWRLFNATDIFAEIKESIISSGITDLIVFLPKDCFDCVWSEKTDLYIKPNMYYYLLERIKNTFRCNEIEISYQFNLDVFEPSNLFELIDYIKSIHRDEFEKKLDDEFKRKPGPKSYSKRVNITKMGLNQLKNEFGIDGGADKFFERYRAEIGFEQFIYNKNVYAYDITLEKATFIHSKEAAQFINVAGNYFLITNGIDVFGHHQHSLEPVGDKIFAAKFSQFSKERIHKIKMQVPYFDKFQNEPNHIQWRKQWTDVDNDTGIETIVYNTYRPISHKPKKGECSVSLSFLKHVFGTHTILHKGQRIEGWELGLDYIKLLYERPMEILPILCLVSQEQKTGKSSFAEWMHAIFQNNMTKVPATDIGSKFTGYWAGKLVIYIEEALIDKAQSLEFLKDMVTSPTQKLELKGVEAKQINNFTKVILTSNRETSFAPISQDDTRFWVRKLNTIPGGPVYNFKSKLNSEIPAFLYFLQEREFKTQWEDRGWFNHELIRTEQLAKIQKLNVSVSLKLITETIMNYMQIHKLYHCRLSKTDIKEMIGTDNGINLGKITHFIEREMNKTISRNNHPYEKFHLTVSMTTGEKISTSETNRSYYYNFTLNDFFSFEEICENFGRESIFLEDLKIIDKNEDNPKKRIKEMLIDDYLSMKQLSKSREELDSMAMHDIAKEIGFKNKVKDIDDLKF
ncbi:MAG TPA: DUF5906 domain-containing protein [Saprospiraceae bacterium]|nr:DUF5906 domain-containing protein [Saprospiraceae bacterium]